MNLTVQDFTPAEANTRRNELGGPGRTRSLLEQIRIGEVGMAGFISNHQLSSGTKLSHGRPKTV